MDSKKNLISLIFLFAGFDSAAVAFATVAFILVALLVLAFFCGHGFGQNETNDELQVDGRSDAGTRLVKYAWRSGAGSDALRIHTSRDQWQGEGS